jgi:hypothetical protein
MSLRNRKNTYVNLVKLFAKQGQLSVEEATGFEGMFRRCRSQVEQHQVFQAMMANLNRLATDTDVYARLHRDDLLETD